jgi:hypothetical protein
MKESILKIICDGYDMNAPFSNTANEIAEHFMRFVEYAKDSCMVIFNPSYGKYFWSDGITEFTTDELYKHWQEHVNK